MRRVLFRFDFERHNKALLIEPNVMGKELQGGNPSAPPLPSVLIPVLVRYWFCIIAVTADSLT